MNKGNSIASAFENGKAFIAFLTAGDPTPESTVNYILAMEKAGADLIEIGIPFSDPVAEGPVIQEASLRALQGGMTTDGVFEVVKKVREQSRIPLVLMTYLNPVFRYGYDRFFEKCQELSISGIIIPDLPFEEKEEAAEIAEKYGVSVISMIAPTSKERIQTIAKEAEGFLYIVSSMGVTGMREKIDTDLASMIAAVREVTDIPCAIGFGIKNPETAEKMGRLADGVIVGSAIVSKIGEYGENAREVLTEYVSSMKAAVRKTDETK